MKKKIIPLFWAVFMIMLLIPANILVFAQGEETTAPEIESAIGKVVQVQNEGDYDISGDYFYTSVTESSISSGNAFRVEDSNISSIPFYFVVVDEVEYGGYTKYYKLATVDGSTNEQLQKTPWLKAILCTVIGDAPQTLVGATANFKTATTIFYENVTESGASGSFGVASLPKKVVIIAEKTVDGTKYYQVALSDGSSDENFDKLPWVKASDVNIIDMPSEEGVIEGQVTVVQNGNTANEIMLAPGEKQYVFTEFGAAVSEYARYQWQMKVVGNGWAAVKDYVYPYAIISDALIQNALDADGKAYVRCMVTDGDKRFVTPEMAVTLTSNAVSVNGYVSSAKSVTARSISDMQNRAGDDMSGAFHITIQYKFLHASAVDANLNGSTAANTFTITLGSGMSFSESIVSPPVLGYKPYVDYESGNDEGKITYAGHTLIPADEVKFNNQSDPIDVIVYYVPQNVTFRVKHFKQNLQDDEYTEWKTEFRQGIADTAVNENLEQDEESLALSEVGFSALYYDKNTVITNDGNTVVEIYYDRIYYLVKYELGGGYGVMPNYVRYGTSVMLGTPTRPGYTFDSWKLTSVKDTTDGEELLTDANLTSTYQGYNVTAANSQVTVAHNLVYTAQWTEQTVKYTIIYWLENADSTDASKKENYSIWHMVEETGSVGNNTIAGSDNIKNNVTGNALTAVNQDYYFISYNAGLTDTAKQVAGDGTTTVNIYYSRNEYTLRFYYARQSTRGNTNGNWYVAGMTNYFGRHDDTNGWTTANKSNEEYLLNNLGKWGQVSAQPTLKKDKGYTFGTLISSSDTYHYLSFKAKYGADIADRWPIDVFNPATSRVSSNNTWDGTTALMSAWTGEWNVKYQHENDNQTIKGKYEVLDSSLMWRPNEGGWNNATYNDKTISFLSFWENAINETWNHPELYRYKIWLPVMGQESSYPSNTQFVTHNEARYYLADTYDTCDNSTAGEQTHPSLTGFGKVANRVNIPADGNDNSSIFDYRNYSNIPTNLRKFITQEEFDGIIALKPANANNTANDSSKPYKRAYVVNYFYTRNNNSFIMDDNAGRSTTHTVPYGTSLSSYQVDPTYPSSFEAGNYTFGGWYQDKACTVAFDFGITMPDKNVTAYAKWTTTVWSVSVYLDKEKTISLYSDSTVEFGSMIAEPDYAAVQQSNPTYKDLIFAGWYYEDGGNEERFDFNTMAIKHDYVIYAKWTSHIPVEYVVRYVAKIDGTETEIAEQTKGVSLAGVSKSFIAKPSSELYDKYRTDKLYLPTVRSQTKEMSTNSSENVITFEYAIPTELRYTIKHTFHSDDVEFATLAGSNTYELSWDYPVQTSGSGVSGTVTVKFDTDLESKVKADKGVALWEKIVDLSPDFYQKELILTMDSAENVVEFNWEDRGVVFVYQVIHKFQNLDGSYSSTYFDFYGTYENNTAEITATPIEIVGFVFDDTSEQTKTFSKGSLEPKIIELYYKRQMMSYKVQYVYGTTTETVAREAVPYEKVVAETAKEIAGYAVSGASTQNVSITYDGQIIVFNYVVQQVIYNYQVVGGVGGNVDKVQERINVTATAVGSLPTASIGYIFVGWYTDEACTQAVDISWWQPNAGYRLIPQPSLSDANKAYNFYAKFVPTKLVIKNSDSIVLENEDQAFVYKVQYSYGGNNYVIEVVVVGNGEVTIVGIPIGVDVTVTPIGDWAWRYTSTSASFSGTISGDPSGITIPVTYTVSNDQWLTDVNNAVNAYTST